MGLASIRPCGGYPGTFGRYRAYYCGTHTSIEASHMGSIVHLASQAIFEHVSPSQNPSPAHHDPHTVLSLLRSLTRLPLNSESAASSGVVPPLSSVSSRRRLNPIAVITPGYVLDSVLDVQPLSLTLEAFLRDSISLDIIRGKRLFQRL